MAMGGFELASASYRPVHIPAPRASGAVPRLPDIPGIFGRSFQAAVKAGMEAAQGFAAMGGAVRAAGSMQRRLADEEARRKEKAKVEAERAEARAEREAAKREREMRRRVDRDGQDDEFRYDPIAAEDKVP